MKKHHVLATVLSGSALLSSGLLSSCSEEQAAPQNAEKTATQTAAAAPVTTPSTPTTPEERAASFPALAHVPATANTYLALHVQEILGIVNKLHPATAKKLPEQVKAVESVALAFDSGNEQVLASAIMAAQAIVAKNAGMPATELDTNRLAIDTLKNFKPVYVAATFATEEDAAGYIGLIKLAQMDLSSKAPFLTYTQENGWNCINCKMADLQQEHLPTFPQDQVADTTITVAYRQAGKAIVAAICNNPATLAAPASAADSILGTAAADSLNELNGKAGILAASASVALQNLLMELGAQSSYEQLSAQLQHLSPTPEAEQKALAAMARLQQVAATFPRSTKPLNLAMWQDGDVHLTVECDSYGCEFSQAKVCNTAPKNSIVYAYGSTLTKLPAIDYAELINAYIDLFCAYSPEPQLTEQIHQATASICKHLGTPAKQLLGALDNSWCFNLDAMAQTTLPLDYDNEAAGGVSNPAARIAFAARLQNKAAFQQALSGIFGSIRNIAAELAPGSEAKVDAALATRQSTVGNANVYTFTALALNEAYATNYAITDSAVALGTSPQLNAELAGTTANSTAAGWFLSVDLEPVIPCLLQKELEACQAHKEYELKKEAQVSPEDSAYLDSSLWQQTEEYHKANIKKFKQFYSKITGGKVSYTTHGGKLIFRLQLHTPCLK